MQCHPPAGGQWWSQANLNSWTFSIPGSAKKARKARVDGKEKRRRERAKNKKKKKKVCWPTRKFQFGQSLG